jgi:hypothetical protein
MIPMQAKVCKSCGEVLGISHSSLIAFFLGLLLGPVGLWYKGRYAAGFAWVFMCVIICVPTGILGLLLAPIFWLCMAIHAAVAKPKR